MEDGCVGNEFEELVLDFFLLTQLDYMSWLFLQLAMT